MYRKKMYSFVNHSHIFSIERTTGNVVRWLSVLDIVLDSDPKDVCSSPPALFIFRIFEAREHILLTGTRGCEFRHTVSQRISDIIDVPMRIDAGT